MMRAFAFATLFVLPVLVLVPTSAHAIYLEPNVPVVYTDDIPGEDFEMDCEENTYYNKVASVYRPGGTLGFSAYHCFLSDHVSEFAWKLVELGYTGDLHVVVWDTDLLFEDENYSFDESSYEVMSQTGAPWFVADYTIAVSGDNRP